MSNEFLENNEEQCYKQLFKEFSKTKDDLDDYISIIRKWAETQLQFPEKPSYRTLRFVILYNKFSIEKAKQNLDMFYTIRSLMPEYFRTTPFSDDIVFANKVVFFIALPKVVDDYKRIIYHKVNPKYEPKNLIHDKLSIQFLHLMQYFVETDLCSSFHYIWDCSAVKFGHLATVNPMALKKTITILEKVFSNRLASIYIVNFPQFLETMVNTVLKPMLNPKIRERVKIYPNADVLLDVFGKDKMPKDIGGEEKSIEELSEMLMEEYQNHKERFNQLSNLVVDESLRPAKLENDDVLGYFGNFKKINLD